MARPVVDLPHPDSPTRPSVSPFLTWKRNAVNGLHRADFLLEDDALRQRKVHDQIANIEQRRSPFAVTELAAPVRLLSPSFTHLLSGAPRSELRHLRLKLLPRTSTRCSGSGPTSMQRRPLLLALLSRIVTSRHEWAHIGQIDQVWRKTANRFEFFLVPGIESRNRLHQTDGVRMARIREDFFGRGCFDDRPGIHDLNAIGHAGHHPHRVGDHDHAGVALCLQDCASGRESGPESSRRARSSVRRQ